MNNSIATTTSRLSEVAVRKFDGSMQTPTEVLNSYFAPSQQHRYAKYPERAVNGRSPFLQDAIDEVGESAVLAWLCSQLYDLSDYCGARTNFGSSAIEQTAQILATQFNLRLSEYMLFFFLFKGGKYGNSGSFLNGTVICSAMRKYVSETKRRLQAKFEANNASPVQSDDSSGQCISAEEYVKMARAEGREPSSFLLFLAGEKEYP